MYCYCLLIAAKISSISLPVVSSPSEKKNIEEILLSFAVSNCYIPETIGFRRFVEPPALKEFTKFLYFLLFVEFIGYNS